MMLITLFEAGKFTPDTLTACRISTGGGMRGGRKEVYLFKDENGKAMLSVSGKETYNDRMITTVYHADDEAFARVGELAVRHRLYAASKRPYSKLRVLDADTTTITFDFAADDFSVSEEQVMSSNMRAGFRAVIDFLPSLAAGEGVTTREPQTGLLYLKSGYTLQFTVEDVFDGRLDTILGKEHEVAAYQTCGIVLAKGEQPLLSGAERRTTAAAGSIVYSLKDKSVILLYRDGSFPEGVYVLAQLDGSVSSASPLIAQMQGPYSLSLN